MKGNVCIDFDGTLAEFKKYKFAKFGKPKNEVIKKVRLLHREGYRIFIQTTRSWAEYEPMREWLDKNDVPYDEIVMGGKPIAFAYLDDRSVNVLLPDWEERLAVLLKDTFYLGEDKRMRG